MLPNALVIAEDDARCSDFDFVLTHSRSRHLQSLVNGLSFRKVKESLDVCLLARLDMEHAPPDETASAAALSCPLRTGLAVALFVGIAILAAMAMKTTRVSPMWTLLFVGVMSIVCLSFEAIPNMMV